jgi:protein AroM
MPHAPRIAFVTIGQSPRVDLTPEILERLRGQIEAVEFGALDDLSPTEVAAMAPKAGEDSLCTRMRDGSEVVIGKTQTRDRLQKLFDRLDTEDFDAITLLCTGYFDHLSSKTLLIEAQRVVDATVDAFSLGCQNLGVILPLERQIAEFHVQSDETRKVKATHYSPYGDDRLEVAAKDVADCDLVVLHCMGYSEAMRAKTAALTNKPVLLARRIVAGAVQQII